MTSVISPTQTPTNVAPSASIPSQSSQPLPAVPAQLLKPSYANAINSASSIPSNRPSNSSSTTGASAPVQHGKIDTTKINGQMSTASPAVGTQQGIVNSNSNTNGVTRTDSHGRKPSVVISASGATGQIPNGGPVGQNARPNIAFGSINHQASPAPANSVPAQSQNSNLSTPRHDPRIISPTHSPSPIPQPPASGGKPPAGLHSQGNGVNFGNFGSAGTENGDVSNFFYTIKVTRKNRSLHKLTFYRRCARILSLPTNNPPIFVANLLNLHTAI